MSLKAWRGQQIGFGTNLEARRGNTQLKVSFFKFYSEWDPILGDGVTNIQGESS